MTGIDGRIMDPVARSAAQRASANARVASPLPSEEWNQSDSMLEDEPMAAEDEGHASLLRAQPTPALVPRASPVFFCVIFIFILANGFSHSRLHSHQLDRNTR